MTAARRRRSIDLRVLMTVVLLAGWAAAVAQAQDEFHSSGASQRRHGDVARAQRVTHVPFLLEGVIMEPSWTWAMVCIPTRRAPGGWPGGCCLMSLVSSGRAPGPAPATRRRAACGDDRAEGAEPVP